MEPVGAVIPASDVLTATETARDPRWDAVSLCLALLEPGDEAERIAGELLGGYDLRGVAATHLVVELATLFAHDRDDPTELLFELLFERTHNA